VLGAVRAVLQAPWMPGVIASLPAVKGLWADIIVATGETGVTTVGIVILKLGCPHF